MAGASSSSPARTADVMGGAPEAVGRGSVGVRVV